jgi:hypothetical protein
MFNSILRENLLKGFKSIKFVLLTSHGSAKPIKTGFPGQNAAKA